MKGIVFTGFLEMIESTYGYEVVDKILSESGLQSGGIYTSVGTYSHSEMVQLIMGLSVHTGAGVPSLLKAFGLYFFDTLKEGYPQFLEAANNAFDFLESIENYIHVEVRKLYPDAELPAFEINLQEGGALQMIYSSERKMADFAEGLIEKSLEYYEEKATIERSNLESDGSKVAFVITKE